ncbi:hypothetical protein M413DRAFT_372910 [Hebeloma cylindrosporum]|uniref:Uncharacterized protein n=1 Tax=Hebeloma cylindrosporum TaxID=76867 RepID=A0A0C3CJR4_HEBCY|nr:hypothetical protein M413DRAFT_372910 [Hebeloma cylindrosporum h7]
MLPKTREQTNIEVEDTLENNQQEQSETMEGGGFGVSLWLFFQYLSFCSLEMLGEDTISDDKEAPSDHEVCDAFSLVNAEEVEEVIDSDNESAEDPPAEVPENRLVPGIDADSQTQNFECADDGAEATVSDEMKYDDEGDDAYPEEEEEEYYDDGVADSDNGVYRPIRISILQMIANAQKNWMQKRQNIQLY